jgi:hypothetical protein
MPLWLPNGCPDRTRTLPIISCCSIVFDLSLSNGIWGKDSRIISLTLAWIWSGLNENPSYDHVSQFVRFNSNAL